MYYAMKKAFIHFAQKRRVLWARRHLDAPKDSGNVFSGQRSTHFSFFRGKTDVGFYVPREKDHPDYYQRTCNL